MGELLAKRSMDDFLINPTTIRNMDHDIYNVRSISRHGWTPEKQFVESFDLSEKTKPANHAADRSELADEFSWLRRYASDEELASPIDNDDFSLEFSTSDDESATSSSHGVYHAQTCNNAQQLCSRAQAVQVMSAGKPRVVTMPKMIDVPSPKSARRPSEPADFRPSTSKGNRRGIIGAEQIGKYSLESSPRSSNEDSSASVESSPKLGSPRVRNVLRRKPNLPKLHIEPRTETMRMMPAPATSHPIQRVQFNDADSLPPRAAAASPTMSTFAKRSKHKLSKSFSIRGFGRSRRQDSFSDSSSSDGPSQALERSSQSPASMSSSEIYIPPNLSIRPLAKMVARGAGDRASPIQLPPCPDGYEEDESSTGQPPRTDSIPTVRPTYASSALHDRRKSLGAFVSTQG